MGQAPVDARPTDRFAELRGRLRLPLIAAPMFLVSGPDLVVAACIAGVAGSFPTANCRHEDELDAWLTAIGARLADYEQRGGRSVAPVCPNLIVHRSNTRLARDLSVLVKHRPALVITSVGSPNAVLPALHEVGALVFSDVATVAHARKAVEAGVDGLILLTAGAGGQTGWLNPFAFVRAVRAFYSGPLVLAGGIADGYALRAAIVLGCDLGYAGTAFIATRESMASDAYREMLVASSADDILLTNALTGLAANFLRPSLARAGLDPDRLPQQQGVDMAADIHPNSPTGPFRRWKNLWSAGHSVSGVSGVVTVKELVARFAAEYSEAAGG